jgi:hypothetical protein
MHRYFYALPEDLLAVLSLVEARQQLRYTASNTIEASISDSYLTCSSIPTLWTPTSFDCTNVDHRYLVTLRDTEVAGRRIVLTSWGTRYAFDHLVNPDTVELQTSAVHSSGALLDGRIAMCSDSPASKRLFGQLKRAIGKHFKRINAFWVGPNAEAEWRKGARLMQNVTSPRVYNLREQVADAV